MVTLHSELLAGFVQQDVCCVAKFVARQASSGEFFVFYDNRAAFVSDFDSTKAAKAWMSLRKACREKVYNGEVREEFCSSSIRKGTYRIRCGVPDISFNLIQLPVLDILLVVVPIFDEEIHFIYVITSWTLFVFRLFRLIISRGEPHRKLRDDYQVVELIDEV